MIERAIDHLLRIVETTGCRVIMDHHALRDARFAERFARLWETGRVVTAAAFLGLPEAPLESRRNRAWAAAASRRHAPSRVLRSMTAPRVTSHKGDSGSERQQDPQRGRPRA